jgi:O-antigen ligase
VQSGNPRAAPNHSLLRRFRDDRQRAPLAPREIAVVVAVGLHLCFLPWALGTVHPWSQLTSLALATVGVAVALWPLRQAPSARSQASEPSGFSSQVSGFARQTALGEQPLSRLVRFPLFWLGAALLAYIAVQALNPSWVWQRNETSWWLRRVDDIAWLPTSIDAPFARSNAWRELVVYASAWLTLCTVWVGLTRRRALEALLVVVLVNAVVLALVGYVEKAFSPDAFLGAFAWPFGHSAFASFIYKNHAGAFFALAAALAVVLALRAHDRGLRRGQKSTPAGLFVLAALVLATAVLATASRGACITLACFLAVTGLWLILHNRVAALTRGRDGAVTILLALVFGASALVALPNLNFAAIEIRFEQLADDPVSTIEGRLHAYDAGWKMFQDHGWRGVGAGGFSHLFPNYIRHHPEVYAEGRLFWAHVHRDWLELPIELGAAGSALLVLAGGYWLLALHRRRAWGHMLAGPLLLACLQPVLHAWFDFPFQAPAIMTTWLVLLAISARWAELDQPRRS